MQCTQDVLGAVVSDKMKEGEVVWEMVHSIPVVLKTSPRALENWLHGKESESGGPIGKE